MTSDCCSLPRSQKPLGIYRSLMVLSRCTGCLVLMIEPASHPFPYESQQHNLQHTICVWKWFFFLRVATYSPGLINCLKRFFCFSWSAPAHHQQPPFTPPPHSACLPPTQTGNLYHLISFHFISSLPTILSYIFLFLLQGRKKANCFASNALLVDDIVDWVENVEDNTSSVFQLTNAAVKYNCLIWFVKLHVWECTCFVC